MIEAALRTIGEEPAWLRRRNRAAPFAGRTPIKVIVDGNGAGVAQMLQFLNREVLRKSLT